MSLSELVHIVTGVVVILLLRIGLEWVLTQARREVITANFRLFIVGQYPVAATWRVWPAWCCWRC